MDGRYNDFRAAQHQHARQLWAPDLTTNKKPDLAQIRVDDDPLLARQQMCLSSVKIRIQWRGVRLLAKIAREFCSLGTKKPQRQKVRASNIARDDISSDNVH